MMLYLFILILVALAYFFMMPKDIRRSMDVFVFAGLAVLIVAVAVSQAVMNQTLILEVLMVLAALGLTIRAWREIDDMSKKRRRRSRRSRR